MSGRILFSRADSLLHLPRRHKFGTNLNALVGVHLEQADGGLTDRSASHEDRPLEFKVFVPRVRARMEEPNNRVCLWSDRCKVRSLMPVTIRTGHCQVVEGIVVYVLSGVDVLDMKH